MAAHLFGLELGWETLQTVGAFLLGKSRGAAATSSSASAGEKDTGLKSGILGMGENDEALFWSAVALAKERKMIGDSEIGNLRAIFRKLTLPERNRLYKLIGRDEQEITIEVKTEATAQQAASARRRAGQSTTTPTKEKESVEKTTAKGNLRGAMTVSLLAHMEPTEAIAFLRQSGTLSGPMGDIKYLFGTLMKFLGNARVQAILRRIPVEGREAFKKVVLWYLGATDRVDAERIVVERERVVALRRAQSWYQRDLKHHPRLLRLWTVLGVIIAIAIAYVFIWHGGPTN